MNRHTAIDLLSNLLERAREETGKTFVTSRELVALDTLLKSIDSGLLDRATPSPQEEGTSDKRKLLSSVAVAEEDVIAKAALCIDFGTSFSKAFASIDTGDELPNIIDLPIGKNSGWTQPLTTPSEMLISEDVIYFGARARKIFDDTQAAPERLIDSIKQYMTLGADVSNLGQIRLDEKKDPKQQLFQRDVLVLYLAHLTFLVETALEAKGLGANMRRRFAHPAWDDANREGNEREMKRMMAQAVVLARSFGDRLVDSLKLSDARAALDELRELEDDLPMILIGEPVREATAAGAGALLGLPSNRRAPYLIVDIGAGTTDVAGCICVSNPNWDRNRVTEVTSAAKAIKSAGNVLDNALVRALVQKSHLAQGSAEYQAAAAALNRHKRLNKERLFADGSLIFELPTQEILELTLAEFLEFAPVKAFTESIRKLITDSAFAVAGNLSRVNIVATGGGARLPMIRKIAEEGVERDGRRIALDWQNPAPEGMATKYPDLVDPYPQIAVALGGALPDLPEQRKSIAAGLSDAPKYYMTPGYKS